MVCSLRIGVLASVLFFGAVVNSACGRSERERAPVPVERRRTSGERLFELICSYLATKWLPGDHDAASWGPACRAQGPIPASGTFPPGERAALLRLAVLLERRTELATALDALFPAGQPLPTTMLSNWSKSTCAQGVCRSWLTEFVEASFVLAQEVESNANLLEALSRTWGRREGYLPIEASSLLADVVRTDALREQGLTVVERWLRVLGESQDAGLVLGTLADVLWQEPRAPSLGDFLFREVPFAGASATLRVPVRDWRGAALPAHATAQEPVPAPFVDHDQNGLADLDPFGRFLGEDGGTLPPPFLSRAEPLAADSSPSPEDLYRFVNVERTLLPGVLQAFATPSGEVERLFDTALAVREWLLRLEPEALASAASFLSEGIARLSEPVGQVRMQVLGWLLFDDSVPDPAPLLAALRDAARVLPAGVGPSAWNALFQDLSKALTDGAPLGADLLAALASPESAGLDAALAAEIESRARLTYRTETLAAYSHLPVDQRLVRLDDDAPESVLERSLALVGDLAGQRICNRAVPGLYKECELLRIEDAADFYVRSFTGDARLSLNEGPWVVGLLGWLARLDPFRSNSDAMTALTNVVAIEGFGARPTPAGLNRFLFLRTGAGAGENCPLLGILDPRTCAVGDFLIEPVEAAGCENPWPQRACAERALAQGSPLLPADLSCPSSCSVRHRNPFAVFHWETDGFYQAVRPLAKALQGRSLAAVARTLSRNWRDGARLVHFEPFLQRFFANGGLGKAARWLNALRSRRITVQQGGHPMEVRPLEVLAEWAAAGDTSFVQALHLARSGALPLPGTVRERLGAVWRRARGFSTLRPLSHGEFLALRAYVGDLLETLRADDLVRLKQVVDAALPLGQLLGETRNLLAEVLGTTQELRDNAVQTLADLAQLLKDRTTVLTMTRSLARLSRDDGAPLVRFVQVARPFLTDPANRDFVRRLLAPMGPAAESPLSVFTSIWLAMGRRVPEWPASPMAVDDYRSVLDGIRSFLHDECAGIEPILRLAVFDGTALPAGACRGVP